MYMDYYYYKNKTIDDDYTGDFDLILIYSIYILIAILF